ncbi:ATP-dependent RNA helicase DBP9 [Fusarium oxysporum f. sp. albedinis]|nr:Heat shock factor protein 2 [Fusarium oxysporum f. sp. albedinis]KAJ0140625.1 ATP-dependent RNA helicase DBP9 [Fusarium oxysporum f. sp. albedinis]
MCLLLKEYSWLFNDKKFGIFHHACLTIPSFSPPFHTIFAFYSIMLQGIAFQTAPPKTAPRNLMNNTCENLLSRLGHQCCKSTMKSTLSVFVPQGSFAQTAAGLPLLCKILQISQDVASGYSQGYSLLNKRSLVHEQTAGMSCILNDC